MPNLPVNAAVSAVESPVENVKKGAVRLHATRTAASWTSAGQRDHQSAEADNWNEKSPQHACVPELGSRPYQVEAAEIWINSHSNGKTVAVVFDN